MSPGGISQFSWKSNPVDYIKIVEAHVNTAFWPLVYGVTPDCHMALGCDSPLKQGETGLFPSQLQCGMDKEAQSHSSLLFPFVVQI